LHHKKGNGQPRRKGNKHTTGLDMAPISSIMSTLKNNVQSIGNVENIPEITNLNSGKKVSRISLATDEIYYVDDHKKQQPTGTTL